MSDCDTQFARLVQLLASINFDRRYYEFYDRIRNRTSVSGLGRKDWDAALAATGLSFRYTAKEKLYTHEEKTERGTLGLKIAFRHDEVEPILVCDLGQGEIGRPFAVLAKAAGQLKDANFSPKPPYPTLPFTNAEELREVVDFVVSLYSEVRNSILASDGLNH